MEFRILGPLEARSDDRQLPVQGAKQRALLALLLLHANEGLSSERLIDEMWGERPPATAAKALRVYVSQLRRLLEPDRARGAPSKLLPNTGSGYLLRVELDQLDLHRFNRLLEEGRRVLADGNPAEAARLLEAALALWHGPALADLANEPFAQMEIARLEELRLQALEQRIEAELQLGRHAELVGELERVVAAHPLRERLRGRLMLALYRSGRQVEALTVYQDARRVLVEELGIEPGKPLRELESAILRQDPALELVPALSQASAEPARRAFVGRERELAELLAGFEQTLRGHGSLYLLVGEPGIGKSRLAEELGRHAKVRGAHVLVGRCWEAGGAPAYWPWVQSLRAYIRGREPEELRAELGDGAPALAQLMPEIRQLFPGLPEPHSTESEGARFRLFDATSSFLIAAAQAQPLVLVLDDLHAADEPSLLLLRFLARELSDSRLLVLGAYRDVDPTLREPLAAALVELMREPVTHRLVLEGLNEPAVARYIELAAGITSADQLVGAIHAETEGNPLFVGELVRLLAAEGRIETGDIRKLAIPEGVREVIGHRLRHLSPECNRVLTLASVLGREFDLEALHHVSGIGRDGLLELLDEAMTARVLSEIPGAIGRLRFAHGLIRDVAYEALTGARRVQRHRQVGEALEDLYARDLEPHLAELAHHFFEAVPGGDARKAIAYARRAGDRAVALLAYEEAARLFGVAVRILDSTESQDDVLRCELLLALGDAYARAGDTPKSKQMYRQAARLAEALRLSEHLGRAALGYGGRLMWDVSRDDEYLVPLLEQALAALGDEDSTLRVKLLGRLAAGPLRDSSVDPLRRRRLGAQALEIARRIGEPSTLAYGLHGHLTSELSPDSVPDTLELAKELIGVALQAGEKELAVEGYEVHLEASIELGDLSTARADLDAMTKLADELHQPAQKWLAGVCGTALALLEGRFGEAEQLIAETRSVGERAQRWSAAVTYGLQLYLLRRDQGRLKDVEQLVRRSATEYLTYPIWRCVLANMLAELDSTASARAELEALAADGFSAIPFDEEWEVSLCFLAEAAAHLDDRDHAGTLYELLLPYADRVAMSYPEISLGSVSRFLGILASTTGHYDEAARRFDDAVAMNERIGARPWLVHTQDDYAYMLLRRGEPGDAEKAESLLDGARRAYRELGIHARPSPIALAFPSRR